MHKGVVLQINFSPNASEVQIRKLLQSVDGSIIEGPGAIGIYRVRLNLETKNEEQINESIAALRSHHDTVIHVARE